jgi:hypothetical protein
MYLHLIAGMLELNRSKADARHSVGFELLCWRDPHAAL